MHAFEEIVAALLEREGYWLRPNFKVELTAEQKRAIGRPSSPRWELDLLGYHVGRNQLLLLECKSYIDSVGVRASAFEREYEPGKAPGYKLFVEPGTRRVVTEALLDQLRRLGAITGKPDVRLGLAAGRIKGRDEPRLRAIFADPNRNWLLWTPAEVAARIRGMAREGYENSVATMLAKLLVAHPDGA